MRITTEFLTIPGVASSIRCYFARPRGTDRVPGIVMYSDIFQLTPSTLRVADRFAGHGFAVLVPEIYSRRVKAGTAWNFDDAGRDIGMATAKATPVAEFDQDARAEIDWLSQHAEIDADKLGAIGFCLGGHLAFRAAFDARIAATVCYYPTGLHNGALGLDADAGSLATAVTTKLGRLHLIFGSEDPHVPAVGRDLIVKRLRDADKAFELSLFAAEHAFMRDEGPRYDPQATDEAFVLGLNTLRG